MYKDGRVRLAANNRETFGEGRSTTLSLQILKQNYAKRMHHVEPMATFYFLRQDKGKGIARVISYIIVSETADLRECIHPCSKRVVQINTIEKTNYWILNCSYDQKLKGETNKRHHHW
jgi:hypothetical protein